MINRRYEAIWAEEEQYQAGKPKQTNTSAARDLPLGARTTICALLAFGALFERKYEDSERLYQAARQCYLDIAELMTLESVQLAMQMAVFEINTNRSRILWSTLAVATRVAHALVSPFTPSTLCPKVELVKIAESASQASIGQQVARRVSAANAIMVVYSRT